jgi:hypothetical protein
VEDEDEGGVMLKCYMGGVKWMRREEKKAFDGGPLL